MQLDNTSALILGLFFTLALVVFGALIGGWFQWVLYVLATLSAAGLVVIFIRGRRGGQ